MKRRIISIILAAVAVVGFCGCSREKSGGDDTHTHATYPPDETIVFDYESVENNVRLMAEQLLGLGEDYTITCEGEDYVQGGEAVLYSVVSGDNKYRMAVDYIGGRYMYSEKSGDFLTEYLWLYEKSGSNREKVAAVASDRWEKLNPDSTNTVVASGSLVYNIPGAEGPAFEAWVMNDEGNAKIYTFAVMPDMKTVYMESDSGFVPFDASGAN